ncbi:unnamed protein product [Cylicocyclus nassatus]|uniref:Uncharacterized protein n=1 Tax=Cylicocyclus nassatus TaxID=53992 RepID=A0AA36H8V7_CYLNA|nr:unnamed protein product [Cylicocyclus nassatus]
MGRRTAVVVGKAREKFKSLKSIFVRYLLYLKSDLVLIVEAETHIQSFPSFREDEDFNHQGNVRVMGVVYSTNMDAASFLVLVDQDGAVIDYCKMVHFTKPGFGPQAQSKKFMERRRPHVIALCGENLDASLRKDVQESLYSMVAESDRAICLRYGP